MNTTIYRKYIARYAMTFSLVDRLNPDGSPSSEIVPAWLADRLSPEEYNDLWNELFDHANIVRCSEQCPELRPVWAVHECGQEQGGFFSLPVGVYSSEGQARFAMRRCFQRTLESLREDKASIHSYEEDPMQTTILWEQDGRENTHMVIIELLLMDKDEPESYCMMR